MVPSGADQNSDNITRELVVMEYKTLRDEILKKMDHRTTYRQTTLTLSLTALGVGVQLKSATLLLVVPMIAILLGNLTIFQTVQISRIATYIRENIEKPLTQKYPKSLGWQLSNEDRPARLEESLFTSYIPNAAIPLTPSLVAMTLAWTYEAPLYSKILMTVVDLILIAYFLRVYSLKRLSL